MTEVSVRGSAAPPPSPASALGLAFGVAAAAGAGADLPESDPAPGRVAIAVRHGIRLFDLADDPHREEHLAEIRAVARGSGIRLRAIVPPDEVPGPRGDSREVPPGLPGLEIVELRSELPDPSDAPARWILSIPEPGAGTAAMLRAARGAGALAVRSPGGLRTAAALEDLAARCGAAGLDLLVADPFEGGRFDGSLLDRAPGGTRPPQRDDGSRRAEAFAPVRPYGFLAIARRRTLGQSVLRFLRTVPGVTAVLVPAERSETVIEAIALDATPPLTPEEIARIRALSVVASSDAPRGAQP